MISKYIFDKGEVRPATRFEIFSQHMNNLKYRFFGDFRFVYWIVAGFIVINLATLLIVYIMVNY